MPLPPSKSSATKIAATTSVVFTLTGSHSPRLQDPRVRSPHRGILRVRNRARRSALRRLTRDRRAEDRAESHQARRKPRASRQIQFGSLAQRPRRRPTASTDYLLARRGDGGQPAGTTGAGRDALRPLPPQSCSVRQSAFRLTPICGRPAITPAGGSYLSPENTRKDKQ